MNLNEHNVNCCDKTNYIVIETTYKIKTDHDLCVFGRSSKFKTIHCYIKT